MTSRLRFDDAAVAERCNSSSNVTRHWGEAAEDVKAALCVLAAGDDLASYDKLPNVTTEGDLTVFEGTTADVVLDLTETSPTDIVISGVDVRARNGRK